MLEYNLCKEFPTLSPLSVEKEDFNTIINLYIDLRKLQISQENQTKTQNGKKVIRRPAGDDWF